MRLPETEFGEFGGTCPLRCGSIQPASRVLLAWTLLAATTSCGCGSKDDLADQPSPLEATMYWTSGPLEPDKLASGWLLQRHIHVGSKVVFLPSEADSGPTGAVAFDVPGARWARKAMAPTFGAILQDSDREDPQLDRISDLVRVGELQFWSLEPGSDADVFDQRLKTYAFSRDPDGAFLYLDSLYLALMR